MGRFDIAYSSYGHLARADKVYVVHLPQHTFRQCVVYHTHDVASLLAIDLPHKLHHSSIDTICAPTYILLFCESFKPACKICSSAAIRGE